MHVITIEPLTLCTAVSDSSFRCGTTSYCINKSKVCNHLKDCPGGEDEAFNCGKSSEVHCYNHKISLSDKIIRCHFTLPDIDECKDHNGHCSHICSDLSIGYKCECRLGYKLANDSKSCEGLLYSCTVSYTVLIFAMYIEIIFGIIQDVNECKEVYGSCSQLCQNLKGNFKCSCVDGYFRELSVNHETCRATGKDNNVGANN